MLSSASQRATRAVSATGQAVLGEQQHDARAERGAVGRQMFVGQGHAAQQLALDPGAGVAAQQSAARGRAVVPPAASINADSDAPYSIS